MRGVCTCLHLGKAGAKKSRKGEERGGGGQGGSAGHKAKETKKRRREVDSKQETLSVMYLKQTQQHNIKSCFHRKQAHRHTK